MQRHLISFLVTGVLCAASVISSGVGIWRQLRIQRLRIGAREYTTRILLMVPIYSLQAYFALLMRWEEGNELLELFRKLYECICVFAFLQLLVCHLRGFDQIVGKLQREPGHCRHVFPVSKLVGKWPFNKVLREEYEPAIFVQWTLWGVLQYVMVSFFCAIVGFVTYFVRALRPVWTAVMPLSNGLMMVSQGPAMYCLVVFYHANQDHLADLHPVLKLLSLKILVMFTVWQGLIIKYADKHHMFDGLAERSQSHWNPKQLADGIINGLLVVEMFILSLAHHYVYPPQENAKLFQPKCQVFSIYYSADWIGVMQAKIRLYQLKSTDAILVTDRLGRTVKVSWKRDELHIVHPVPAEDAFPLHFNALDPDPTCPTSTTGKEFVIKECSEEWKTVMQARFQFCQLQMTDSVDVTDVHGHPLSVQWVYRLTPSPNKDQFPLKFQGPGYLNSPRYISNLIRGKWDGRYQDGDGMVITLLQNGSECTVSNSDDRLGWGQKRGTAPKGKGTTIVVPGLYGAECGTLTHKNSIISWPGGAKWRLQANWDGKYVDGQQRTITIRQHENHSLEKVTVRKDGTNVQGRVCGRMIKVNNNTGSISIDTGIIEWRDGEKWSPVEEWNGEYVSSSGGVVTISQASDNERINVHSDDLHLPGFECTVYQSGTNRGTIVLNAKEKNDCEMGAWCKDVIRWDSGVIWSRIKQKQRVVCRDSDGEKWQWAEIANERPLQLKLDGSESRVAKKQVCFCPSFVLADFNGGEWQAAMHKELWKFPSNMKHNVYVTDNKKHIIDIELIPEVNPEPKSTQFPLKFRVAADHSDPAHPAYGPQRCSMLRRFGAAFNLLDIGSFLQDLKDIRFITATEEEPDVAADAGASGNRRNSRALDGAQAASQAAQSPQRNLDAGANQASVSNDCAKKVSKEGGSLTSSLFNRVSSPVQ
eukprot:TRINITY_DN27311_c0_g1_i1.p1 TRINITY_DN27311_c0_g1~~TRINITY_DN27311_c0_g1_i1.p1  ORF type:complete len:928 (-),score=114.18 TRINITY_DN27311_c0_g1_i1:3-2786(-)